MVIVSSNTSNVLNSTCSFLISAVCLYKSNWINILPKLLYLLNTPSVSLTYNFSIGIVVYIGNANTGVIFTNLLSISIIDLKLRISYVGLTNKSNTNQSCSHIAVNEFRLYV